MFTGLVEGKGVIRSVEFRSGSSTGKDKSVEVEPLEKFEDVVLGESIAIDGVCLTVVGWNGKSFKADVSSETLSKTTLKFKKPGDVVNLERALKAGDRLGGHLVLGHVDCLGIFKSRREEGRSLRLLFSIPEEFGIYVVEKGSIAVNGVSLTVNNCEGSLFDVNIIPHTASVTNIGLLKDGDLVNIETDIIGKYVVNILKAWQKKIPMPENKGSLITEEFLKSRGFLK